MSDRESLIRELEDKGIFGDKQGPFLEMFERLLAKARGTPLIAKKKEVNGI